MVQKHTKLSSHPLEMRRDNLFELSFYLLQTHPRPFGLRPFPFALTSTLGVPARSLAFFYLFAPRPSDIPPFFDVHEPPFSLDSPDPLDAYRLKPPLPFFDHIANFYFISFLQRPSRMQKILIPRYEHGHMVVALKWFDNDSEMLAFTKLSLGEAHKSTAHFALPTPPVLRPLLGPKDAAEHYCYKQPQR